MKTSPTQSDKPTQSFSFTTEELIKWAKEQETWANEFWLETPEAIRGYKLALQHLKIHVSNPEKEII